MLLAPLIGISFSVSSFLAAVGVMLVVSFALNGLSFCIAWRMSSTQGFHVIMNLFLLPMFLLSGAMFPAEGAKRAMRWVMDINPLTYGVSALRRAIYWSDSANLNLPSLAACLGISLLFAAVMFLFASLISRGRVAADWQ
jgi:ABC-2 type transport system permease protein